MPTSKTAGEEVVTVTVDLRAHKQDVTVVTTVITGHGEVVVTFDPHTMH